MGLTRTGALTAVLGPTNTGKTHLAVERLCAHSSGIMGFPLRLLAREVYDRVKAIKGEAQVALITGEEKIIPPQARYFLCTAESMPLDREVSFLALDEAQMGQDAERGHVFTDRLLRARGRDETMILGSDSLAPLIRRLLPDAEIIGRPRFSTLSHAAPKKLSRLPKRSAIVAFSAEDVYAIAEMLRRHKGGAAVVMGGLSPRTRNAQVALYQSGEVDYLVATDAIGMGLNMDISHVAFASLGKFDGRRKRRLTPAEMGQIAGRAGRHQRDGTFGVVHFEGGHTPGFEAEEVLALEAHSYAPLTELKWRNADLDFSSISALIATLETRPNRAGLTRTDDTIDMAVLRLLAAEPDTHMRANSKRLIKRLWAACQIPDYRKTAADQHARLVSRLYSYLSQGRGTLPTDWLAGELARLDQVSGDIDTLQARIAGVRTWTYIAHQPDWLDDPEHWAERARALEDKLSDALHDRLTQRFVDRRTTALLKDLAARGEEGVTVEADGAVAVGGEAIGTLDGFTFTADPTARHADKRRVMAAAERALQGELGRRARQLGGAAAADVSLDWAPGRQPGLIWRGQCVAQLDMGKDVLSPRITLCAGVEALGAADRGLIKERLYAWLGAQIAEQLAPMQRLADAAAKPASQGGLSGAGRGLAVQFLENAGTLRRDSVRPLIEALTSADRATLRKAGVRLGALHLFIPAMLRPAASRWRLALWALRQPKAPALWIEDGRVSVPAQRDIPGSSYTAAGYWKVGAKAVRVDMVERLADALRDNAKGPIVPPADLISMMGLSRDEFAGLMGAMGYRQRMIDAPTLPPAADAPSPPADPAKVIAFQWKGRPPQRHGVHVNPKGVRQDSPFAALAALTHPKRMM
jgi:ATP-dependent RNA helicase SUPV3L1/SUV3